MNRITLPLALTSLLLLAGCGTPMKFEKKDYKGYFADKTRGVSVQLETTWTIHEGLPNSIMVARSAKESDKDEFQENVVLNDSKAVKSQADLDGITKDLEKELPGFKTVASSPVNGGFQLTFVYESQGRKLRAVSYFVQAQSPLVLTFTSTDQDFDRWKPKFDSAWSTVNLAFVGSTATPAPSASGSPSASPSTEASSAPTSTPSAQASPAAASVTPSPAATGTPTATPSVQGTPTASPSSAPVSSATPASPTPSISASATPK
jgi:hypothetical protein